MSSFLGRAESLCPLPPSWRRRPLTPDIRRRKADPLVGPTNAQVAYAICLLEKGRKALERDIEMQICRTAAVAFSAICLASCGGGGTGSSAPPVTVTPTPAPAPTPTPTPTPTPSPTYAEATDFSGNRDYPGWGVQLVRTYTAPPFGSPAGTLGTSVFASDIASETRAAGFIYTAATKTYVARWFAEERSYGPVTSSLFQGLIPTDTASNMSTDFFRSHFRVHPTIADYTRYVGFISWSSFDGDPSNGANNSVSRSYYSLFGTTSVPSDLPTTGAYQFNLQSGRLTGGFSGYVIGGVDDLLLSVNWGTGAITGTLTLQPEAGSPAGTQPLVMNFSGTVNTGSSRVSGNVTGPFSGTFSGAMFGPQGRELGIAMNLSNSSGGKIVAVAGGRRQ